MSNSLVESYTLSPWAKRKGLTRCFFYRGLSMIPTFQNGDFLYLSSSAQNLYPGDVVVFTPCPRADYVVHRIISRSSKNFITRGDHNRFPDTLPIAPEQIVGKVEFVENKNGTHRVANGILGLWRASIWHSVLWLDQLIRRMLWMPYNFIREKRITALIWHPKISKIQVQSKNGLLIKYLYKNSTVAIWDFACQRFECRKPFDLIISNPEEPE